MSLSGAVTSPQGAEDRVPPPPSARGRAGLRGVARGGALNLAGAAFSAGAGFAVTALIARGLGPARAGVLFAATSAFLIGAVLAKLGTPVGLVYWLARLRALGHHELLGRCLRVALAPVAAAGALAGAALWLAAPWLAALTGGRGEYVVQLRVLAVFLPLAALSDAVLAATRGYRTMAPTVLVERVARSALQVLAVLAVIVAAGPVTAYTLAWGGPYLPALALGGFWLAALVRRGNREARAPHAGPPASGEAAPVGGAPLRGGEPVDPAGLASAFWRFTAPRAVASVAQLALQRLDVLLVAGLLGFAPAALYAVATRFLVVGQLASQAVGNAAEPRIAEQLARDDRRAASTLYQGGTGWLVLVSWPMYLISAIFAPLYLALFGRAYRTTEALAVVVTLSLAMLVASACGTVDVVLSMSGRTSWQLINVLVALAVNVGADLLLIPRLGIFGAGLGWALALLVKNAIPIAQIGLVLGLHPFGRGTLGAAALAVLCFGGLGLVLRVLLGPSPLGLAATLILATPAYLAGVWRLREPLALSAFAALRPRRRAA